jgi:hypothetical protein
MSDNGGIGSAAGYGLSLGDELRAKAEEVYLTFLNTCLSDPPWSQRIRFEQADGNYLPEQFQEAFAPFARSDLGALSEMRTMLSDAVFAYERDEGDPIDDADDYLKVWTGDAADAFKDYLGEIKSALAIQKGVILKVNETIAAQEALVVQARQDALAIADRTLEALANVDGASTLEALITAGGVVAGIVAAAPTLGATGTLAAAVVSGMADAAAKAIQGVGDGPSSATIGGAKPWEVVDSMFQALRDLNETVAAESGKLALAMRAMSDYLAEPRVMAEILPRYPNEPMSLHTFHLPGDGHGKTRRP